MSWFLKATRKAIKFFHETDLDNLYSIINKGIQPSGGQMALDDFGRPERTWFGAYFGRDESSLSHGHDTKINRKMVLQGWLPIGFMQEYGEADADYIYRQTDWFSSQFYPNAPYDDDEEKYEINHEMGYPGYKPVPKSKQRGQTKDPFSWNKSYWQKPYGAAAVKKTIPFDWVENIRIGKKWFPKSQAIKLLTKELDRQKEQNTIHISNLWKNWQRQNEIFRMSNFPSSFPDVVEKAAKRIEALKKEYNTIKHLLTPEQIKTTEVLFDMKDRDIAQARQKAGNKKAKI